MKKKPIPQKELTWKDEPFALIQESGVDFTAVLARENERARDRQESDRKHLKLFEEKL